MSVDVTLNPQFKAGVPRVLFRVPIYEGGLSAGAQNWDVSSDSQRFLINTTGASSSTLITVELNWQAGLKK
jgi:hypothetical protein